MPGVPGIVTVHVSPFASLTVHKHLSILLANPRTRDTRIHMEESVILTEIRVVSSEGSTVNIVGAPISVMDTLRVGQYLIPITIL